MDTPPSLSRSSRKSENPQDPLYLSEWPDFLWNQRRLSCYNLPKPEVICQQGLEGCVVYWITSTFRARENLALETSIWLAQRLQVPLLAVTLIDKDVCEDVFAGGASSLPVEQPTDMDVDATENPSQLPHGTMDLAPENSVSEVIVEKSPRGISAARSRASFATLSALGALQIELSSNNISLTGVIVEAQQVSSSSSGGGVAGGGDAFSLDTSRLEAIEAFLSDSVPGGAVAVFTDSTCCPSHAQLCHSLVRAGGGLSSLALFSIDSESFCSNGVGKMGSTLSADSGAMDFIAFESFVTKFDHAVEALMYQNWSFHAAAVRGNLQNRLEESTSKGGGVSTVNWKDALRLTRAHIDDETAAEERYAQTALLPPPRFCCCWTEKRAVEALEYMCGLYEQDFRHQKQQGEGENKAATRPVRSDCCAVVLQCLGMGLVSPVMLYRSTSRRPQLGRQMLWRDIYSKLTEADYARHVCSSLAKKMLQLPGEVFSWKTVWAHLVSSQASPALSTQPMQSMKQQQQQQQHQYYPAQVCSGQTSDTLFNAIQLRLVSSGTVPAGLEARYWVAFFMRATASPDLGLQAALVEIARHAPVPAGQCLSPLLIVPLLVAARQAYSSANSLDACRDALREKHGSLQLDTFVSRV